MVMSQAMYMSRGHDSEMSSLFLSTVVQAIRVGKNIKEWAVAWVLSKRLVRNPITAYPLYNHATSNLVIYCHETAQDKLSEA